MEDLLRDSVARLKQGGAPANGVRRNAAELPGPYCPAAVLYMGKNTGKYHEALKENIAPAWRASPDVLRYLALEEADLAGMLKDLEGNSITMEDFNEQITSMKRERGTFENMREVLLFCLFDTSGVQSGDEFLRWYGLLQELRDETASESKMLLLLLLDETPKHRAASMAIRTFLYQYWRAHGSNIPECMIVLSNHQGGSGGFVSWDPDEKVDGINNLFADILLLTNTADKNGSNRERIFFSKEPFFTVAYRRKQSPMEEFSFLVYEHILEAVWRRMEKEENGAITAEELDSALNMEEVIKSNVDKIIPARDCIPLLPRGNFSRKDALSRMDDESLDMATLGCWNAFVREEFLAPFEDESDVLFPEMKKYMTKSLIVGFEWIRLRQRITDEVKKRFWEITGGKCRKSGQKAYEQARERSIEEAIAVAQKVLDATIQDCQGMSNDCYKLFDNMRKTMEKRFANRRDDLDYIRQFYSRRISESYDAIPETELLNDLFQFPEEPEQLKSRIYGIFCHIADTIPEFSYSYVEELTERYRQTSESPLDELGKELSNDIETGIYFSTGVPFNEGVYHLYLFGYSNDLVRQLRNFPQKAELTGYFNTGRHDLVETLVLYRCERDKAHRLKE